MTKVTTLALAGTHHRALRAHLFPGDGLEAVAFLACGRRDGDTKIRLTVQEVFTVPHAPDRMKLGTAMSLWSLYNFLPPPSLN